MYKLFRYSGNKCKFPHISLPASTKRLVEPFCGSCGFSLQYNLPTLAMDSNLELVNMLKWLQSKPDSLEALKAYEGKKVSVRELPVSNEAKTYLRVNIASVCVGQLSSYTIYPQHKLPIEETKKAIERIQDWEFLHSCYTKYKQRDGDFLFIDPPYLDTSGNYGSNGLDMNEFVSWIKSLTVPYIITYKEPIQAISNIGWNCWLVKKVPNMRRGGSSIREDWYYTNA